MASSSGDVSVEATQEYSVQEVGPDGQEVFIPPLTMSESLTKMAEKIDFGNLEGTSFMESTSDELMTFQSSLWPWDSVRNKLKSMLTEIDVLSDVLHIAKEKRYLAMDRVSQAIPEPKPNITMLQKKKALAGAADILLKGAERLRQVQEERPPTRTAADYHIDLLQMRQAWRLKKVGDSIIGDLSYRTTGSRYKEPGTFEVVKNEQQNNLNLAGPSTSSSHMLLRTTGTNVILPNELEGTSYIHVSIQNDTETILSCDLAPLSPTSLTSPDSHWQQKLEAAQNVLFCKELFSQLAKEAVQLQSNIPNLVVGNQITTSLFPGVQLIIGLVHLTASERAKPSPTAKYNEHKPVLEHSLHQLLREVHYNALHYPMPHPITAAVGISKKRRLAGPEALDKTTIAESVKTEFLLEQIIRQTRHVVLRLRTMYIIDTFACEIKDPLLIAHWGCLSSPTISSVKINILSDGYETMCRTPLAIHVCEKSIKAVCRDGRTMFLSYEAQELRYLLMCQVSQHQINAAQALAKIMGWKVLSTGSHIGVGTVEPIGNASSVLMASPVGDRLISMRCGPRSGINVSVSYSPQQQDCYPSTLVRDRKWQNLSGNFREVCWEKMEGRNFVNKLELLMASLTTC